MNEERLLELQDRILAKLHDPDARPFEILVELSREMAEIDADLCAALYLPTYDADPEQAEGLIESSFEKLSDRLGRFTRDLCGTAGIPFDRPEKVVRTATGQAFWGRMHAISNAITSANVGSVQ